MNNDATESSPTAVPGGKDKARKEFVALFHTSTTHNPLTPKAEVQLERIFEHTAGRAIDTGKIDWLATDAVTRKKKKFYLACVKEVADEALVIVGSGKIDKAPLLAASDKVVARYRPKCELKARFIFCTDYDSMPRD